jgi:hypothetical protein
MEDPVVYGNPKPSKNPIVELAEQAVQEAATLRAEIQELKG